MKTFTTLLAGCALAAAGLGTAQAQSGTAPSQVTLYGLIDAGVEYIDKVGPTGGTLWRMPSNTSAIPSRLGFRGQEALGDGLSAIFTLEMGLFTDSGTFGQGGRAFGRQSFVGLAGPWGSVTLGRQYTMLFWSLLDADVMGANVFGMGSFDAYIPNARSDNTLAWRGKFGGFSAGAAYSFGRDVVNGGPSPAGTNCPGESATDGSACRAWSVLAKYDTQGWGAAFAYDRQQGRTPASASDPVFGGLTSSSRSDSRLSLNGYVQLGAATRLGGGLLQRDNDGNPAARKSRLWYVGVSTPLADLVTLDASLMTLRYSADAQRNATLLAARVNYNLSKRSVMYAQVGRMANNRLSAVSVSGGAPGSAPAAGVDQNGLSVGLRHSF
ncbi:porin [Aquabacterium sp.]|uniref:porin n=1 Tax=Aquabacterium sp. TaxID=1872578 RepID=UPI00378519FA